MAVSARISHTQQSSAEKTKCTADRLGPKRDCRVKFFDDCVRASIRKLVLYPTVDKIIAVERRTVYILNGIGSLMNSSSIGDKAWNDSLAAVVDAIGSSDFATSLVAALAH